MDDRGKMNAPTVLGIIFIVFFFGLAAADVGELIVVDAGETYGWGVPFGILFLLVIPFILGYIGGQES